MKCTIYIKKKIFKKPTTIVLVRKKIQGQIAHSSYYKFNNLSYYDNKT